MGTETTNALSPFAPDTGRDMADLDLIARIGNGDRAALEALLGRHKPWIFNLAFRMVLVRQDAEDVTQEILIKVLTSLSTYDPSRAAFRTWLYRIVVNHVINMRKRGYETFIKSIDEYYSFVTAVPDSDPDCSPESQMVAADVAIGCVMGVLLCLEREQRVAFILAIAFNVSDTQGSEIMGISSSAFRKTLSRARAKMHEHMHGNCGVMNPDAPCRCSKKVTGFVQLGGYGPDRLTFVSKEAPKLEDVVGNKLDRFNQEIYAVYARVLRAHPFYRAPEMTAWLRDLVERREFKEVFDLSEESERNGG